jgi:hypothetical protein
MTDRHDVGPREDTLTLFAARLRARRRTDTSGRHGVVHNGLKGSLMDELKRTYRDVETEVKKTARDVDGTDLKDHVGNAGDEARKDLGNLGDDVRTADHDAADHGV